MRYLQALRLKLLPPFVYLCPTTRVDLSGTA